MKTHLFIAGHVACGGHPMRSPMIRDPRRVDCALCRRTEVFKKVSAASARRRAAVDFEQMGLFDGQET